MTAISLYTGRKASANYHLLKYYDALYYITLVFDFYCQFILLTVCK